MKTTSRQVAASASKIIIEELSTQECVHYDKNFQEVIVRNKRRKIMGPFSAIGSMSRIDSPKGAEDIFDLLGQVSKGAYSLFLELKRRRDENTNLTTYTTTDLNKTQRESISRQLKELRDKGIVRVAQRVMQSSDPKRPYITEKQTYMLNPGYLKCWQYEDADLLWEQCKP